MDHPQAEEIEHYWAKRFGCARELLSQPGFHVVADEETDPHRMMVLGLTHATLVRTTSDRAEELTELLEPGSCHLPDVEEVIARAFPTETWTSSPSEKVLYLHPEEFYVFPKAGVRQLTETDSKDLTTMHRGCLLEEQQAGEVNIDHPAIFGAYVENQLVAAASFIDQGQGIWDVGVLVHRDFRKQGFGRAVVSALCEWGLDHGKIVQYWRKCSNTGSVNIASSLGFTEYARFSTLHWLHSPLL